MSSKCYISQTKEQPETVRKHNAIGNNNNNNNSKGEIQSEECVLPLYATDLLDIATDNELFSDKKWEKENQILDETLNDDLIYMPGSKKSFERRKSQELIRFQEIMGIEKLDNLKDFEINDINSNTHSNSNQVLAQQQQQHMMIHAKHKDFRMSLKTHKTVPKLSNPCLLFAFFFFTLRN